MHNYCSSKNKPRQNTILMSSSKKDISRINCISRCCLLREFSVWQIHSSSELEGFVFISEVQALGEIEICKSLYSHFQKTIHIGQGRKVHFLPNYFCYGPSVTIWSKSVKKFNILVLWAQTTKYIEVAILVQFILSTSWS